MGMDRWRNARAPADYSYDAAPHPLGNVGTTDVPKVHAEPVTRAGRPQWRMTLGFRCRR
jgi:hypothetical protein